MAKHNSDIRSSLPGFIFISAWLSIFCSRGIRSTRASRRFSQGMELKVSDFRKSRTGAGVSLRSSPNAVLSAAITCLLAAALPAPLKYTSTGVITANRPMKIRTTMSGIGRQLSGLVHFGFGFEKVGRQCDAGNRQTVEETRTDARRSERADNFAVRPDALLLEREYVLHADDVLFHAGHFRDAH